jgi:hypothetical protein
MRWNLLLLDQNIFGRGGTECGWHSGRNLNRESLKYKAGSLEPMHTALCQVKELALQLTAERERERECARVCVCACVSPKNCRRALVSVVAKRKYLCMWSLCFTVRTECLHNAVNLIPKAFTQLTGHVVPAVLTCMNSSSAWVPNKDMWRFMTLLHVYHFYEHTKLFQQFPLNINSVGKRCFWESLDWRLTY